MIEIRTRNFKLLCLELGRLAATTAVKLTVTFKFKFQN